MKCHNCGKEYNLITATDRADQDGTVRCPHCKGSVGKRNS